MLSAKEALKIYNDSLCTLLHYLDEKFHNQIKQASANGNREYYLDLGSTDRPNLPEIEILPKKAIEELRKLGYSAEYKFQGERYVPRGLADDCGNDPDYCNYGIVVRW